MDLSVGGVQYGGLFIGVSILLIVLIFVALLYALKMRKRSDQEHGNAEMLDNAVTLMYSKTVKVNLADDTYIVKSSASRGNAKSHTGYDDNIVLPECERLQEGYDRDDYLATFSKTALLRAFTIGEKKIRRRYRLSYGEAQPVFLIVEAILMSNDDGDATAMVLTREERDTVDNIDMKKTLQLKEDELKQLMEQKTTLTGMLQEQSMVMDKLAAQVDSLNKEKEEYVQQSKYSASNKLSVEPADVRTSIREVIPMIQQMIKEAGVGFSLEVDEMPNPRVYMDTLYVNAMILNMLTDAIERCDKDGKIIFLIKQKTGVVNGWAMYEYSCIYLGNSLTFNSEIVDTLGGSVVIDRTEDGGNVLTVNVKYAVAE